MVEATGYYHLDLAQRLNDSDKVKVMVINPRAAKHFASALMMKLKNDAADAEMLSIFAERMEFIPWVAPESDVFALRACGRRLIALTKERTKAKNQRHALTQTKATPAFILEDIDLGIKQLDQRIASLTEQALELIQNNKALATRYTYLTSIKGVADQTSIKLLGELGVLDTDMKGKQWVAHAALYPREYQSGSSVKRQPRIGKSGNRYIREALYMAALSASRHEPHIKAFYQHLIEDNGLTKLQAICAIMRIMLLAMHGMLRTEECFNGALFYQPISALVI